MEQMDAGRRHRRRRGSVSVEQIVTAALATADRLGVEKMTIRQVASAADIATMSLYSHFASKEELLDLMYEEIVRRLYTGEPHPTWQEELSAVCQRVRSLLVTHPSWAPLLSRAAPPTDVPGRERVLALMISDGWAPSQAFAALVSTILVAEGLAMIELNLRAANGHSAVTQSFEQLKAWADGASSARQPTTQSAIVALGTFDLDRNFASTITAYLDGLVLAKTRGSFQ